ncbi:hypothetical protein [Alloactinosynnema sp. L-07]|nr:hypothetical protein [Alloactinosynnema sp. L-07]
MAPAVSKTSKSTDAHATVTPRPPRRTIRGTRRERQGSQ